MLIDFPIACPTAGADAFSNEKRAVRSDDGLRCGLHRIHILHAYPDGDATR